MVPSERLGSAVSDASSVGSVVDHGGSSRNFPSLATRRVLSGMSLLHPPVLCHRTLCVLGGGKRETPWDLGGQEQGPPTTERDLGLGTAG